MDVSDDEGPRDDPPVGGKSSVTSDDVVAAMLEVRTIQTSNSNGAESSYLVSKNSRIVCLVYEYCICGR